MSASCLLGVDIGTSSCCKAVIAGRNGAIFASVSVSYQLLAPQQGWHEQDLQEWAGGVRVAARKARVSAPDIVAAVNKLVVELGAQPLEVAHVEKFIGEGARSLVKRVFVVRGLPADPHLLDEALPKYTAFCEAAPAPFSAAICCSRGLARVGAQ